MSVIERFFPFNYEKNVSMVTVLPISTKLPITAHLKHFNTHKKNTMSHDIGIPGPGLLLLCK